MTGTYATLVKIAAASTIYPVAHGVHGDTVCAGNLQAVLRKRTKNLFRLFLDLFLLALALPNTDVSERRYINEWHHVSHNVQSADAGVSGSGYGLHGDNV